MLAKRIIPCLDIRDGKVVKGVQFRGHKIAGDIVPLARRYAAEGADELVLYDIVASVNSTTVCATWVRAVARELDIPFAVAGGIKSVADAGRILENGADKVSVNTPALLRPELLDELVHHFGSQCIVLGVDSFFDSSDQLYHVYSHTGSPNHSRREARTTVEWVQEATSRGIGEVVVNVMNQDGRRSGYDLDHLSDIRRRSKIPVIASGGAGSIKHFADVFSKADVSGALAASVFHSGEIAVSDLKTKLNEDGICVRI